MAQNGCVPFSAQFVVSHKWHKTVVCHFWLNFFLAKNGANQFCAIVGTYCEPKMAQNCFMPFSAQPKIAENGFAKNV